MEVNRCAWRSRSGHGRIPAVDGGTRGGAEAQPRSSWWWSWSPWAAGGIWWSNNKKAKAAQEILDAGGRFAERDKVETGAFWNCVTSSEVDVGNFKGVDQIQQRIESAYFTQQKTFSDHLTTECVPKIERARQAPWATGVRDSRR